MDNRSAFLFMIAFSEGTAGKCGDDGYSCLVGGSCFTGYADHPRIFNKELDSTAAGRYQILEHIFDAYKAQLQLHDFGPESQDAIALQLIKECDALADVDAGAIDAAVTKCTSRWASFPGAEYGQREQKIADLQAAFSQAGGILAT